MIAIPNINPCPICGKTPKIRFTKGYGWDVICEGHHETSWYASEDSAIETWNEETKGE